MKNTWDKLLLICCIGNYLGELYKPQMLSAFCFYEAAVYLDHLLVK